MKTTSRIRILTGIAFAIALPLMAHHPFASEFDANKPVTLTGTIDRTVWENPHANVFITVSDNGKTENWQLETAAPGYLEQHGMKASTFAKGKKVTVRAYQASNGSKMASARRITVDGADKQVCDAKEDGGPAK
jgi:hypothetical protein